MRGLSTLMVIVVTIIVVLIAALIMVTIFGKQLGLVAGTVDEAVIRANCELRCTQLCINKAPGTTVDLGNVVAQGQQRSCSTAGVSCVCGGSSSSAPRTAAI